MGMQSSEEVLKSSSGHRLMHFSPEFLMKNIRDAYDLSNHPTTKRCLEHQDMEQILGV
jgi:hypothetical protein